MERGMCRVPIEFIGIEASDKVDKWTEKICSNDSSMILTEPDFSHHISTDVNNLVPVNPMVSSPVMQSVSGYNGHLIPVDDEFDGFAYQAQRAKKMADLQADLAKEKMREHTVLSHGFSNYGYLREKTFADGCRMSHTIANGNIVNVRHWLIGENEFASLLVEDTTPGIRNRKTEWTTVFNLTELERDRYIEQLLSKYFNPSDARAYYPVSIKEFRSRIYEAIRSVELEIIPTKTGWYNLEDKRLYFDGSNYPTSKHILGQLRRVKATTNVNLEDVLSGICKELDKVDRWNRLSFLIGYGMVTWLSEVCSLNWNKRPGVMIFGNEEVCRRYAEACMKMYVRVDASDIVTLAEANKKSLLEYAEILKDDVFLLDCNNTAWNGSLVKSIITGRSIANRRIEVPIVTLQDMPSKAWDYEDYVTIDLSGYKISEPLCLYMQELKAACLSILEDKLCVGSEMMSYEFVSYEEAANVVFPVIKQHLWEAGISMTVLNIFFGKLGIGMTIKSRFCGDAKDMLVFLLKQRLEQAIECGKVSVTGDIEIGIASDPKRSLIVRNDSVYIPAKYLNENLLSLLHFSISDFHRIREVLVERGLLNTYDVEESYTKRITISKGERIYAYELDKSLFTTFKKIGL